MLALIISFQMSVSLMTRADGFEIAFFPVETGKRFNPSSHHQRNGHLKKIYLDQHFCEELHGLVPTFS